MKKLLLSMTAALISATGLFAQSQIPNGSFETGSGDSATGWIPVSGLVDRITSQQFTVSGQNQTQNAIDGTYFLRLTTKDSSIGGNTYAFPGVAVASFPYTDRPKFIMFHAMYLPKATADKFSIQLVLTKYNADSGKSFVSYVYTISSNAGTQYYPWTRISAAINYGTTGATDTMYIFVRSAAAGQNAYGVGTTLWIDRMKFTNNDPASVVELRPDNDINSMTAYPNPAISNATIAYSLTGGSKVNVRVYDMSGRMVAVFNEGMQAAGGHQLQLDASNLKAGLYFYQLQTETSTKTGRLIISK